MGTASKHALAAVKREIDTLTQADAASARALFEAVGTLSGTKSLVAAFAERGGDTAAKRALAERIFGARVSGGALRVLTTALTQNWESERDLVLGVQEAAIRSVAQSTGGHELLGEELDAFLDTVSSNGELELSLSSRLGTGEAKVVLIDRLFGSRLGADTLLVLRSLVQHSAGRRIRRLVSWARDLVADQADRQVATVTVARPLPADQLERLQAGLSSRFGREVSLNQVVDPSVIGGLRIEFGDELIDDTAAARLKQLRLQLA